MATQKQVLTALAPASGPMSRSDLEKEIGEPYSKFQTVLDRLTDPKKGLIEDVGAHHYVLTEKGREEALEETVFKDITGIPKHSEESLATTEYQQFIRLGKLTGVVPLALIQQTADHVWEGGDFRDMKWVAQAMMEMDIRKDLRGRWLHSWRTKMHQPIPDNLPSDFAPDGVKKAEETGGRKRDYILSEDDLPVQVGEGRGDLDYKDALELAKIRTVRRRDTTTAQSTASVGSLADQVTQIFRAFREAMGDRVEGKSYVVKPTAEGYEVEEVEPGKPLLVPTPQPSRPSPSYYVEPDGSVKELNPGQPVVIIREPPRQISASPHYLIDKSTGEMKEVAPGQPVVIIKESAPAASQFTPIQVTDKDGNPIVLDLATYIKLDEHRDKQRQQEEGHQTRMDIAKSFKELLLKASIALGHMGEEGK